MGQMAGGGASNTTTDSLSAFSRKFVRGRTLDSGFATTISSIGLVNQRLVDQSTIGRIGHYRTLQAVLQADTDRTLLL